MSNTIDDDDALIAAVSNGSAIAIVLQPDHSAMGYAKPTYNETYDLPFVYQQGAAVAGVTRPGHLIVGPDQQLHIASFSYNNITPLYSIHYVSGVGENDREIVVKLNSTRDYAFRRFVARPPGPLVYRVTRTSAETPAWPEDLGLTESIKRGAKHRIVLGLDDQTVWSLPIDIAYDYFTEQRAEFRTEATVTSRHCIYPQEFHDTLMGNPKISDAMVRQGFTLDLRMPLALTYIRALSDGAYLDAGAELNGTRTPFQDLRVYETSG
ncbi:MAG: hypothetical protein QNJ84_15205 [Alphaproteobacteria bacterium]|nr:hypothetical protein [Alphaproteobacteria bacterium]